MAPRAFAVTPFWTSVAAAALLLLAAGPFLALVGQSGGLGRLSAADWAALRFTVWQAALSAALSVLLALPVAFALHRRRFAGRGAVIGLLGAPFVLPVILVVFGLIGLLGRRGIVTAALAWAGLPALPLYGASGVIFAHVVLNLPFATRLILFALEAIPSQHHRLAAALNFGPWARFRHLAWPALARVLPGVFGVVFLICTASFSVALILGGGPAATTLELALYQAFRFEFDLPHAASLGLLQLALALSMGALFTLLTPPADRAPSQMGARPLRHDPAWLRAMDYVLIGLAALMVMAPVAVIVSKGMGHGAPPAAIWPAALRSVLVALSAASLTVLGALALAQLAVRRPWAVESGLFVLLSLSPMILGMGVYLLLYNVVNVPRFALPILVVINGVMALPFAARGLLPAYKQLARDFAPLCGSLGMPAGAVLRHVVWPRMAPQLRFAFGLSAALSAGDLGAVTLLSTPQHSTLPHLMYQYLGSYRMADGAMAGLVLLGVTLALYFAPQFRGRTCWS
jgi:thiamine transport system permease protein